MKFDELAMYAAIVRERERIAQDAERLGSAPAGSDYWYEHDEGRLELTRRVRASMIVKAEYEIIKAWGTVRKSQPGKKVDDLVEGKQEMKKLLLKVRLFEMYGARCFYAGRGKGLCSDEVEIDRILPGNDGGEYTVANCILACSRHNGMRSDMPLVDFLSPRGETSTFLDDELSSPLVEDPPY